MADSQTDIDFQAKLLADFLEEAHFILESIDECLFSLDPQSADKVEVIGNLFRYAHTIKGSSAVVGLNDIKTFAHSFEDLLAQLRNHPWDLSESIQQLLLESSACLRSRCDALRSGRMTPWCPDDLVTRLQQAASRPGNSELNMSGEPAKESAAFGFFDDESLADQSDALKPSGRPAPKVAGQNTNTDSSSSVPALLQVKVSSKRLDAVVDYVGELIVLKSQLQTEMEESLNSNPRLQSLYSAFDRIVRDIQDRTLGLRMSPLKPLFLKMRRLVNDTARKCDKQVHFIITGEDVEVERSIVESLHDPIMHMLRNSIDHGFENVDERLAAGKPEKGTLQIKAAQVGSNVIIDISDDGKGLSRDKISMKVLEKSLATDTELKAMSDEDVFNLIFLPGFSTAESVSDLSGRGVGLDVVRTNIRKLRGSIKLSSQAGKGTTFSLALPVEAAITDGILAKVQLTPYIFPLDSIQELIALDTSAIIRITPGSFAVNVRGKIVPLAYLDGIIQGYVQALDRKSMLDGRNVLSVIAIESQGRTLGIVVDEIVGQTQVVLKSFSSNFKTSGAVAGSAVLGDGKVAIVLNPRELIASAG